MNERNKTPGSWPFPTAEKPYPLGIRKEVAVHNEKKENHTPRDLAVIEAAKAACAKACEERFSDPAWNGMCRSAADSCADAIRTLSPTSIDLSGVPESEEARDNNVYRIALNAIASWSEGPQVNGSFDEPGSAEIARAALKGKP